MNARQEIEKALQGGMMAEEIKTQLDAEFSNVAKNLGKLLYLKVFGKRDALSTVLEVSGSFLTFVTRMGWMISPYQFDPEVAEAFDSLKARLNTLELAISEFCETGSDDALGKISAVLGGGDFATHMDSPMVNDLTRLMSLVCFWDKERRTDVIQGNAPLDTTPDGSQ